MIDSGLTAVQSRVAQLQSLFAPSGAYASSSSGTAFADSLAAATGTDSSAATTASSGSETLASQAISTARKYLGVPYRWGGTDPDTGLDCSGFTQLVYRQLGVTLPRVAADQAKTGTKVDSMADAKPGDLLFFGSPVHHVGIYEGNGMMIDAPHTGASVSERKVWAVPSQIRRVLPSDSTGSSQTGIEAAGIQAASIQLSADSESSTADDGGLSTPYAAEFTAAGQRYGVDPALLAAVAKAESGYNPGAVSTAGAQGLMQLMPSTADSLGVDPLDPAQAIDGGARLLSSNLRSFNGRVDLALAAYNAGAGNVRKYGGVPPFAQTQNYVAQVQNYWGELR